MFSPYYILYTIILAVCILLAFQNLRLRRIHYREICKIRATYDSKIDELKAELARESNNLHPTKATTFAAVNVKSPDAADDVKTADEKLMQRITAVINANLKNSDLDIAQICDEVGISRVHLHRKMKELTDQTPHEYVRNLRLEQAARLLTQKEQSITEVVYSCGFGSVSSFSTIFKKMYGVSPREYIKRHEVEKNAEIRDKIRPNVT